MFISSCYELSYSNEKKSTYSIILFHTLILGSSGGTETHFITSGNGGEYRKTYHGFAPGHALQVDSPASLQVHRCAAIIASTLPNCHYSLISSLFVNLLSIISSIIKYLLHTLKICFSQYLCVRSLQCKLTPGIETKWIFLGLCHQNLSLVRCRVLLWLQAPSRRTAVFWSAQSPPA